MHGDSEVKHVLRKALRCLKCMRTGSRRKPFSLSNRMLVLLSPASPCTRVVRLEPQSQGYFVGRLSSQDSLALGREIVLEKGQVNEIMK